MLKPIVHRLGVHAMFALAFVVAIATNSTATFALTNLLVQGLIFVVVAHIPAHRTGMMSFVDGAWPFGLVALGIQTIVFGGLDNRTGLLVGGIYVTMGARMAVWATREFVGGRLTEELQRYRYQRLRWKRDGFRNEKLSLHYEISVQGCANASVLAVPAFLASSGQGSLATPALAAVVALWAASWVLESMADHEKASFGKLMAATGSRRTCDVGLWRYSRHPNYFFQWMQWNALVLIGVIILLNTHFAPLTIMGFAYGLAATSALMIHTLIVGTGATPAEHYSVQSRPDYLDYQRRTNKFIPGRAREN